MRLVIDVLFCEAIHFRLPATIYYRRAVAPSQEEALRGFMAEVGLELIDYGSFAVQPQALSWDPALPPRSPTVHVLVDVYSKAYRESTEREAGRR